MRLDPEREKRRKQQVARRVGAELAKEGRLTELGVFMGKYLAEQLKERDPLDNSNRNKRLSFDQEYAKYRRVLQRRGLSDHSLRLIEVELNRTAERRKKERMTEFGGILQKDMIVEGGVAAPQSGTIGIPGCPFLSGWIQGLKEGMGWKEKKYVDLSYFRTPLKSKKIQLPNSRLHLDVQDLPEEEETPISIYFATRPTSIKLHLCGILENDVKKRQNLPRNMTFSSLEIRSSSLIRLRSSMGQQIGRLGKDLLGESIYYCTTPDNYAQQNRLESILKYITCSCYLESVLKYITCSC
jgi:hypothetical protein